MTYDQAPSGQPPIIDIRTRAAVFSSAPRLILGLLIGVASLGVVGWLVIGSVFDVPWFIAAPMSVMFGAAFVAWQVKRTWRGYLVSAVLALSGLARLLHGAVPRASVVAWLGLLVAWVVVLFGDVFDLPQWLQGISPFEHLGLMPLQDFRLAPFLVLTVLAAALSAAGQVAFRHRDVGL